MRFIRKWFAEHVAEGEKGSITDVKMVETDVLANLTSACLTEYLLLRERDFAKSRREVGFNLLTFVWAYLKVFDALSRRQEDRNTFIELEVT